MNNMLFDVDVHGVREVDYVILVGDCSNNCKNNENKVTDTNSCLGRDEMIF